MKVGSVLVTLGVLVGAALCVRLGFWQISRLHEKQALNAALRAAESGPALVVDREPPPTEQARHRMLEVTGRFDERRQFLLSGRAHDGAPGVEVVTPLRLAGSSTAILVNRGWLPAADAATARPDDYPEPGERVVRGLAEELRHGAGGPPVRALGADSLTLWSVRWLDADSVTRLLPYAVAGYALREFPGPGVPERPRRTRPRPYNEMMHLSYAVQWFLFATIMLGGSVALAWSRRRRAATPPDPETSP
jgi:surfeit locus 1 family protein